MGWLCSAPRLGALIVATLLNAPLSAAEFEGRVVGINDGDTLTVLDADRVQHKLRLAGIDAPEKHQPFGQRSKQNLSALSFDKEVHIEWTKMDRYGRKVAKVRVASPDCSGDCPKSLDVGVAQLTVGLAWWYRAYAREQSPEDRGRYEFAEFEAKAKRVGLWGDRDPVAPWEWRRTKRAAAIQLATDLDTATHSLGMAQAEGLLRMNWWNRSINWPGPRCSPATTCSWPERAAGPTLSTAVVTCIPGVDI